MSRAPIIAFTAVLLAACATQPVASVITLPMAAPAMPSRDVPKGEPLPAGASVAVPPGAGTIDAAALAWSADGTARVRVEWPPVSSYRLQLVAIGHWDPATRIRVLDGAGAPLHADTWNPAANARWWSAVGDGCCITIEISGRPGAGALLQIVAADALSVVE